MLTDLCDILQTKTAAATNDSIGCPVTVTIMPSTAARTRLLHTIELTEISTKFGLVFKPSAAFGPSTSHDHDTHAGDDSHDHESHDHDHHDHDHHDADVHHRRLNTEESIITKVCNAQM